MKKLLTITITVLSLLSCDAQEPTCINCFTQEQIDSLKNVKNTDSLNFVNNIDSLNQVNSSQADMITAQAYIINNQNDTILNRDSTIANLRLINKILAEDQLADTAIRNTFNYVIKGISDNTTTIITKKNSEITTIIDDGIKRIRSIYNNGDREIYMNDNKIIGDSVYTYPVFHVFVDSSGKSGIFNFNNE